MSEEIQETPAAEQAVPVAENVTDAPLKEEVKSEAPQEAAKEEAADPETSVAEEPAAPVAQVLREVSTRRGATKRFDVIAVGELPSVLNGLKVGEYTILSGNSVQRVAVSYRTVQDVIAL